MCEHEDVIYGDDDERGVCKDCGATCDWHWEVETMDNYPDYIRSAEVRVPDRWYTGEDDG